jgi:hypothetical protein
MEKHTALRHSDQIRAFRDELESLERDGIFDLDEQNRDRLMAYHRRLGAELARRHGIDAEDSGKRPGLAMLCLLGILAVSTAAFCFYHYSILPSKQVWLAFFQ